MALRLPRVEGYKLRHRFVEAGERHFHVARTGEGPPIVLLHGWPQHWYCWRLVIPKLSSSHRVAAMDLRGFGWSDIAWEGFDKETMADDVAGVIEALELGPAFVVGHDWGGWIAYLLALRRPELVERLVTLNAPAPFLRPTPGNVAGLVRRHQLMMASPLGPRALRQRPYVTRTLRRWSRRSENLPGNVRGRYWLDIRASTRTRAAMLFHRTWLTRELGPVIAGRYRSQRLEVPTLALYGERDPIVPARLFRGLEERASDLRVEGVPGAGHMLPEERPDLVAERALEFFSG
jgi:pimeloyl-ACP methyl ester carboxylesterase